MPRGHASPSQAAPITVANRISAACIATAAASATGSRRTRPVARKNSTVATMPAPKATPPASHTCRNGGAPASSCANAITGSHNGRLASESPNTRCVASSSMPARSRCSSRPRLPSGYANALTATQPIAIHAPPSSRPPACANCIISTPATAMSPHTSAAGGMRRRASRYSSGAHSIPATTVSWNVPATSHAGPLAAA
jgi:hypothetical protein